MAIDKFSVTAVIVAAGVGTRMGGVTKPLIDLGGITVIEKVLTAFDEAKTVDNIIVVCRASSAYYAIAEKIKKPVSFVKGGSTRAESAKNGVIAAKSDFVAIHDCARPFIRPEDIDNVNTAALKTGAASACAPVYNTTKYIDDDRGLIYTPSRSHLVSVQTPQVFKRDLYLSAIAKCESTGYKATDDATLVEYAGFKVEYTPVGTHNFKLTDPRDVKTARALMLLESKEKKQ